MPDSKTQYRPTQTLGEYVVIKKDPVKEVRENYNIAKKAAEGQRTTWTKIFQSYHGYIASKNKKLKRANFHHHKIFPQIELEAARYVTGYFTHKPFVAVSATDDQSTQAALLKESLMQHYYEHCPNFFLSTMRSMKHALLYGSGFRVPTWKKIVKKVKKPVAFTLWGQPTDMIYEEDFEEVVYEGLWFHSYSPSEIFPDPYGYSIQEKRYIIIEEFVPAETLLSQAESDYYDISKVKSIPLNSSGQQDIEYFKRMKEIGQPTPEGDKSIIRLQHQFAQDNWKTLANDEVIIRNVDNPLDHDEIPVTHFVKTIDTDSFWPIGSARNLLQNQKLINLFMDMLADSALMSNYPIFKYRKGVDPNYLISVPNNRVPVESMEDFDVVKMPEMKHDLLALKAVIENNSEEITGYYGPQKGYSQQKHTATSDTIFQQQGDKRIQSDVMGMEQISLLPEAKQISSLIDQNMPDKVTIRMGGQAGARFNKISPEDIKGEYVYQVAGISDSINRMLQKDQLVELYKIGNESQQIVRIANGMITPVPLQNNYYALKELYEAFDRQDTDKYLFSPMVFGNPIENEDLRAGEQPVIPGMDQLNQHPITGAYSNQPWRSPLTNLPAGERAAVKQVA